MTLVDLKFHLCLLLPPRVSGFYRTPDIGYSFETNSGNAFNYFSFGAAVAEVEIDTLTGDHEVHHVEIVMDVGASLNPAIDVGQVEGAFAQGYGLFVLEEMLYSPKGQTMTTGPGTYVSPAPPVLSQHFP